MDEDFPFSVYISALNQLPPANDDIPFSDASNAYPTGYPTDFSSQRFLDPSTPFVASTQPLTTTFTDAELQNELNLWTNAQFKFDIPFLSDGNNLDLNNGSAGNAESRSLADVYLNLQDFPVPYTNGVPSPSANLPLSSAATSQMRIPSNPTRKRTRSLNSNIPSTSMLFPESKGTSMIPNIPYSNTNFSNTNGQSYLFKTAGIPAAELPPLSHLYGAYPSAVRTDARASELLDRINASTASYIRDPSGYSSREYTAPDESTRERSETLPITVAVNDTAANLGHFTVPGATDDPGIARVMDQEDSNLVAAHEDKRRRNTAASARFRVKKKQREQALERTAKEMTERVEMLEAQVAELTKENKWLRGLLVDKDPRLLETADVLKEKVRTMTLTVHSTPTISENGSPSRVPPTEPATAAKSSKKSNSIVEPSVARLPPAPRNLPRSPSRSQPPPSSSYSTYTHIPAMPRAKRTKARVSAQRAAILSHPKTI